MPIGRLLKEGETKLKNLIAKGKQRQRKSRGERDEQGKTKTASKEQAETIASELYKRIYGHWRREILTNFDGK